MQSYLVIPDIHGQITKLKKALGFIKKQYLEKRSDIHVVFLGDYIDRGEPGEIMDKTYADAGSLQVMLELLEFQHYCKLKNIAVTFLLGNHEDLFREHFLHGDKSYGLALDEHTVHCFEKNGMVSEMMEFIEGCSLYLYDKPQKLLFVHAGIDPDKPDPTKNHKQTMLWVRWDFINHPRKLPMTVVFGHTPLPEVINKPDRIGLDGGAFIKDVGFNKLNILFIENSNRQVFVIE